MMPRNGTEPDRTARPSIAAVAIAKNEQTDIRGFLDNLLPWVDEIVVVDDGSTDDTVAILEAAGPKVKVVRRSMDAETGFAGQRNAGIDAASSDWLMHMDVDERVTPELAADIVNKIGDPNLNGLRYRRLNFFLHRPMHHGGWQHWNNPQIARRGHHRFENCVHEQCVIEGGEAKTGQLEGFMWHLNDEDYVERVSKNLRYMQLTGQEILDRGTKVGWARMLLHPAYRALRSYLVEGGYREGTRGLLFALYTFSGTFNWYAFAWDKQNHIDRAELERRLQDSWDRSREGT